MKYISGSQFAERLGISRTTVSNYVRRKKSPIRALKQSCNMYLIAESEIDRWKVIQRGKYKGLERI